MTGRILIVDTVPTNRIVLKVKMLAAQFSVDACGSRKDAEEVIARQKPDLILINLSDPIEDQHGFCRELKENPDTAAIAIISVGVADTARARFAALDAGADDVLPRPINDALLLARMRSLLRVRHARHELMLRDGTSRALGFEESRRNFDATARIALLSRHAISGDALAAQFNSGLSVPVTRLETDTVLANSVAPVPDLFVIDGTQDNDGGRAVFRLISDLRSRAETRLSTLFVILPHNEPEIAAMVLDLGADDAVSLDISDDEMVLRARALVRQKLLHDKLRDTVRDGLHAAVTDPLTGLYNRRYVEPHLSRMAEQARVSQREFAVMMLDIDHFKSINDRYGHAAGDKVLIEIANRLRENLRAIDLVARIGGEEFMVAMPNTNNEQGHIAADRLRKLISARPFSLGPDKPQLNVTMSVGVAVGGLERLNRVQIDTMCNLADEALYAAKSAGRDKVAMSQRLAS
ncbi:MAG: two-component system cell cycle response regulator [Gammaproteobacteria bacterium]|jgi:two-component system cell cycle response regulator